MPGLLVSWLLFPVLLLALSAGCGLLVEKAIRRRIPGALVPAAGLALMILTGQFLALGDDTAELMVPAAALLAVTGFAVGSRGRGRPAPWAALAAAVVFGVFAAPIVASGEPTTAGFIKLDDTATWLALTDRVVEHGRSLEGLAPSSYEATLFFNLADGYPIGVFVPLGIGGRLLGEDIAWLAQPYMAVFAALLALALWELAGGLVRSQRLRALVALIAAQPALLFGYYLWGGIKELAAAALIATAAALAPAAIRDTNGLGWIPLALIVAAAVAVLSPGGLIWLLPLLAASAAIAARTLGARTAALRAAAFTAVVALLTLPVWISGALKPPTSSPLTSEDAVGNLIGPLRAEQVAGIWPAGDFRLDADAPLVTGALIAIVAIAAVIGLLAAWRSRAWASVGFVLGTLLACAAILVFGSPWVDGKALATASAALPFAAALGGAALWIAGRRLAGGLVLAALAGGVLWSNALAYREVNLAPSGQLAELERIGEQIAGEGPALMTEYQPYGVRHFLREADAEGLSELRRRAIPLRSGETVPKGDSADTDRLDPDALLTYRTLVLRRSPLQSRPPYPYELRWRGDYYEVWQRPAGAGPALREHLGLGKRFDPAGRVRCGELRRIITTSPGARLAAVRRERPLVIPRDESGTVVVERPGTYGIWLGGTIRGEAEAVVDGRRAGSARHQLNNQGQFIRFGEIELAPGAHEVRVERRGADLHPGSGGPAPPEGPVLLTRMEAADSEVELFQPAGADRLCRGRWDWVAVVEPPR
jgi:hypothetical protein